MMRLQKILAEAGVCSRRKAEELIRAGRVTVGGRKARLGEKADPEQDDIRLDGRPVRPEPVKAVYLFNKPKGIITTLSDPQGRPSLAGFLDKDGPRLFPVGRLDRDASGLLILTNDGRLAQRLNHPRFGVEKTYHVRVRGRADAKALKKLAGGVLLDDRPTKPAKVRLMSREPRGAFLSLTIHEGRNHQVKRMCRRVGLVVEELTRVGVGPLHLADLPPGRMRPLEPREMDLLARAAGLEDIGPA